MKMLRLFGPVAASFVLSAAAGAQAQSTTAATDAVVTAQQEELANVQANRGAFVGEIVDRWRANFRRAVPSQNIGDEAAEVAALLQRATPEVLLAASRAQSYEELSGLLSSGRQQPSVILLEPGRPIPNTLGSITGDLVFTPITPCRIIDTRLATGGLAGRLLAGFGKQFQVNLADYTAQGGSASGCGLPAGLRPGGVAINVTSTDQTGVGNLRAVQSGGGIPTVSLLNYTPGVNLANAAVASSSPTSGLGDIFILSSNSDSHVIVDIMGYFAPPVATALSTTTVTNSLSVGAGGSTTLSASCPAGRTATGGGCNFASFSSPLYLVSTNPLGSSGWNCAVQNRGGVADTLTVYVVCGQVPGR